MLVFGGVKRFKGDDLGHNRVVPVLLGAITGRFKDDSLRVVLIHHRRSILCADVGTLTIERGRIVDEEKDIEKYLGWKNVRIKLYPHYFGVASSAACNPVVVGCAVAAGIATLHERHAFQATKHCVDTPKAAATKDKLCHISSIRRYTKEVNAEEFRELIWSKGRELYRDMPWRRDTRPYYVLVSELMLQQTQVDRVVPKFEAFIERFPNEKVLAGVSLGEVLALWSGLGYNRRAKFLHDAAKMITAEYSGIFPETLEQLVKLPGVGPNTAGAILAYAFNQPSVFIETNVRTVYFTHFFEDAEKVTDTELRQVVSRTIDREHPREFYQALMDYGTWLKRHGGGRLTQSHHYKKQAPLKGSVREVRGEIIRRLTVADLSHSALANGYESDDRFEPALGGLVSDGLVEQTGELFHLTK